MWVGAVASMVPVGLFALFAYTGWQSREAESYGIGYFVATPILQGVGAGVFSQYRDRQEWSVAARANWLGLLLLGLTFLVFCIEGIVCLLMATPLIIPLSFLGAYMGWSARQWTPTARLSGPTIGALVLMVAGGPLGRAPESRGEITTVWHVASPPERVWPSVLRLDAMPKPDWWLFRLGVAYPVRTLTHSDGRRECVLSTGAMPERVIDRVTNRHLAFRVLATPPSMQELNPFGEVRAPHLTTTYVGGEGEFTLTPEGEGTRIVARSTYGLRMAPFAYWRFWSDAIVAHVHERVVREIRIRAERARSVR